MPTTEQESSPLPARPQPAARQPGPTQRSRAKESRRQALLSAAATLFAVNGFNRVSLEDLGAAAGVSGPAVYRHFPGKQAVLGALLLTVSQDLLDGGRHVVADAADPCAALTRLVQFHVDFALSNPDVIRVQDRDFSNLTARTRRRSGPCSAATWSCGWTCLPASTAKQTRPTSGCAPTRPSA